MPQYSAQTLQWITQLKDTIQQVADKLDTMRPSFARTEVGQCLAWRNITLASAGSAESPALAGDFPCRGSPAG